MWLLAGLGNPGPEHRLQRHNVGFMALDRFVAQHFPLGNWRAKFEGAVVEFSLRGEKVLALKPLGLHERVRHQPAAGGQLLQDSTRPHRGDPRRPRPRARRVEVKQGGGHGGHNGLRSADAHLGKDYWRLRIGIGHPAPTMADKEMKQRIVLAHVLGNFGKQDWAEVEPALDRAEEVARELISGDAAAAIKP